MFKKLTLIAVSVFALNTNLIHTSDDDFIDELILGDAPSYTIYDMFNVGSILCSFFPLLIHPNPYGKIVYLPLITSLPNIILQIKKELEISKVENEGKNRKYWNSVRFDKKNDGKYKLFFLINILGSMIFANETNKLLKAVRN